MSAMRKNSRFLVWAGLLAAAILLLSSPAWALRFVFYADSRGDSEDPFVNEQVLNLINQKILKLRPRPELVIFGGDMAYRGGKDKFEFWKTVMTTLTDQGIGLYIAIGNHELYKDNPTDSALKNQEDFQQVFNFLPEGGPNAHYDRLAYSFESLDGDSLFAVLATWYVDPVTKEEYSGKLTQAQLTWVARELAESRATHKFVITHRPVFGMGGGAPESTLQELWQIMDDNRVDIFFCGHEHLYSRKTIDSKVDPNYRNNVVQVMAGSCGAPLAVRDGIKVNMRQWHVNLNYNFSVVDVSGCKVAVNSYGLKYTEFPVIAPKWRFFPIDKFRRNTVDCPPRTSWWPRFLPQLMPEYLSYNVTPRVFKDP